MKRKALLVIGMCIFLSGCSQDAPTLLTPAGEQEDNALVTKGELYDMAMYDSTVTADYVNVKIGADGLVNSVNAAVGQQVKKGDILFSMNTDGVSGQVESVDAQIEKVELENAYMNDLLQYDIDVARLELQMARDTSDSKKINEQETKVKRLENDLATQKIEQQKDLAQLQLDKLEGDATQGDVEASFDGTIVYMASVNPGDSVPAGAVMAIIARDDSAKLFGEYIESSVIDNADQVYALIGAKEYKVTNVPYDQFELANRIFWNLPLYSTFYYEDAPEVTVGSTATIVVISNYKESALQIPSNALYSDTEGYYVYQKQGDEFERVDVKVGIKTQTSVEITEGLEEGDEVYVKP